jgi:DNA-binding response OmpR family regulator
MSKHILISEDEAPLRQGLMVMFEGYGYRVTDVADGAAAMVGFVAVRPVLVLLDVIMP